MIDQTIHAYVSSPNTDTPTRIHKTGGQPVTSPKTNEVVIEPIVLPNVLVRSRVLEYKERVTREWREIVELARKLEQDERELQEAEARAASMDVRRKIHPTSIFFIGPEVVDPAPVPAGAAAAAASASSE